jgi:hypothetical protein
MGEGNWEIFKYAGAAVNTSKEIVRAVGTASATVHAGCAVCGWVRCAPARPKSWGPFGVTRLAR